MLDEGRRDDMLEMIVGVLQKMALSNSQLEWRLQAALRQLYKKKSERISPEQLALFLSKLTDEQAALANVETPAAEIDAEPKDGDEGAASDQATTKKTRGHGRKPLPEHLPRETKVIPVPEGDRVCAQCGGPKDSMGFDQRETLEFRPAQFVVLIDRIEKCVCKRCQEGVVSAPAPAKPIDGARPGPGLLAQLVTAKLDDSTPLYRQSKIYARSGVDISPSTLGEWFAATADICEPLWKLARRQVLESHLISADDTGMPVLDRDQANGVKRGHIWTYLGDVDRVAYCEYTPTWKGDAPQTLLASFRGVIQGDGYAGYDKIFTGPSPPIRAGCMDHCRRKFVAAMEAGDPRAAICVSLIGKLYDVEARAREDGVGAAELCRRRQVLSRPVMVQLARVIADLHNGAVPKSPLGKATTYAINQWQTLMVFLDDGRVPLSNAHVERQQRLTALGRKNFLFAGSDEGARRLAILMTVVTGCKIAKVSVFDYLKDVIAKLSAGWPASRLAELAPVAWAASQNQAKNAQAE